MGQRTTFVPKPDVSPSTSARAASPPSRKKEPSESVEGAPATEIPRTVPVHDFGRMRVFPPGQEPRAVNVSPPLWRLERDPEERSPGGDLLAQSLRATFGPRAEGVRVADNAALPGGVRGMAVAGQASIATLLGDLASDPVRRTVGHEVAHVLQQQAGRGTVGPLKPGVRAALEAEARQAGAAFVRGEPFHVRGRAPEGSRLMDGPEESFQEVAPARLTVSLSGVLLEPRPGTRFSAGPKLPQGLALVLSRLLGPGYSVGLEHEVLRTLGPLQVDGQLVGDSIGDEEVGQIRVGAGLVLRLLGWLSERKLDVALSEAQRKMLVQGVAAGRAWEELHTELPEESRRLPAWYGLYLFTRDLSNQGELLERYMAALELDAQAPTPEHQTAKRQALRGLLNAVAVPAQVLEAIRQDAACVGSGGYQLLWPSAPVKDAKASKDGSRRTTPASEGEAPVPVFAAMFLGWLPSQQALWEGALTRTESRKELLARFERFTRRTVTVPVAGDERVVDRPGRANLPAFRATLTSHPALSPPLFSAALTTDYRFLMQLQMDSVIDYLGLRYGYFWELVQLPVKKAGEEGEVTDLSRVQGSTPSWSDVAKQRFARTTEYNAADIRSTFNDLIGSAGPPGLQLVAANALLRYMGTGVRLATEWVFSAEHGNEQPFVFSQPGAYLVRCRAWPVLQGGEEVAHASSEAYQLVFAHHPSERAELQVGLAARQYDAELQELAELEARSEEHPEDSALLAQVEELRLALKGKLSDNQAAQVKRLEARLKELGPYDFERREVKAQLETLRALIERREEREPFLQGAERIIASFVGDEGQTLPLLLEVSEVPRKKDEVRSDGEQARYYISDLTLPQSGASEATGRTKAEAIQRAVRAILESTSGYGRGHCVLRIDGVSYPVRIEMSRGALLMEALSNVTTALSAAAVVAAPFTGGASLTLLVPLGAAGALPSAWRIADRTRMDSFQFDLNTAMDLVNIVGGVAGVGAAGAMVQGARTLTAGRLTAGLRMVALGDRLAVVGLGANGLGVLLMSASMVRELASLEALPPGLRLARTMELLGRALRDAGIQVGSSLMMQGVRMRGQAEASHASSTGLGGIKGLGTYETGGQLSLKKAVRIVEETSAPLEKAEGRTLTREGESRFSLLVPRLGSTEHATVVTVELVVKTNANEMIAGSHPDSGPVRMKITRGEKGWHAEIQIYAKLTHSEDLRFSMGHELAEIADIVQRFPNASQLEIEAQMRAGVFQEGASRSEATAHDRAAAKEMGALYRELQRLQQEQARNGTREGAVAMAKRRAQVDQALQNMGLDEPAHLGRKLELLTESGAPPELVTEVQTRHERARQLADEALAGTGSARDDALRALSGATGAEFEGIKALAAKSPRDVMDILRVYYVKHFRKPANQIAERLAGANDLPNVREYVETRLKGAQETQARGYPYGFKDKASFDVFKSKILALLKEYGMPTDDVVVQGGAVTKSPAKDIDIAVMVDAATYEAIRLRLRGLQKDADRPQFDKESKTHINSKLWGKRSVEVLEDGALKRVEATFPSAAFGISGEGVSLDVSVVARDAGFDLGPFILF